MTLRYPDTISVSVPLQENPTATMTTFSLVEQWVLRKFQNWFQQTMLCHSKIESIWQNIRQTYLQLKSYLANGMKRWFMVCNVLSRGYKVSSHVLPLTKIVGFIFQVKQIAVQEADLGVSWNSLMNPGLRSSDPQYARTLRGKRNLLIEGCI